MVSCTVKAIVHSKTKVNYVVFIRLHVASNLFCDTKNHENFEGSSMAIYI